ncbi:MAG: hypothetical protein NXY57DRAFT_965019 [Lentinula lateritia]|nr:MAG: hypothetical protein NXY57DRAFT_965019 [Lentinula lateritia]
MSMEQPQFLLAPVKSHLTFEPIIRSLRTLSPCSINIPRMDTDYDAERGVVWAFIEVPGVHRENLKVILANDPIIGQRGIQIWGFTLPPDSQFGQAGVSSSTGDSMPPITDPSMSLAFGYGTPPNLTLHERKYGEFFRFLPVPTMTKAREIYVELNAGVLTISFICQKPMINKGIFDSLVGTNWCVNRRLSLLYNPY